MSKRDEPVGQSNAYFWKSMVPVINNKGIPLFPCKERRARSLIEKGLAKPFWQKGFFCIKLIKDESKQREKYIELVLGIDPGSKREGFTVASKNGVVLNITTNTPDWVSKRMEIRKNLRRKRRYRKTPYRKMRSNRAISRKNRITPSILARWNAKLRIINILRKILPITLISVEDIQAKSRKKNLFWNNNFSPLEIGKNWFYQEIIKSNLSLIKIKGFETASYRKARFPSVLKSKNKLEFKWESHNIDSHSLCEIALGTQIKPFYNLYQLNFLMFHRRQLHLQSPGKNNFRRRFGTTISLGMVRGSCIKYNDEFYYLGGNNNGKISIHDMMTGKRVSSYIKPTDIQIMYIGKWRIFLQKHDQKN